MNKFAERLKELRIEKRLTQKELANKCGVSARNVSYWEAGERECDFNVLITLSDALDTSIDYLLGKTNFKIIQF